MKFRSISLKIGQPILFGLFLCFVSSESGAAEDKPEVASVQIINATSVAKISLTVNGQPDYPDFPQGLYTADAPVPVLKAKYLVKDLAGGNEKTSEEIAFAPNSRQSVVIFGDFSTKFPDQEMPQAGEQPPPSSKPFPPNVFFRVYPHSPGKTTQAVRLRVLNAMPGLDLQLKTPEGTSAIKPGETLVLEGQPPLHEYLATIKGQELSVLMRQEDIIRNAILIFFLKEGQPSFMRAFENVN